MQREQLMALVGGNEVAQYKVMLLWRSLRKAKKQYGVTVQANGKITETRFYRPEGAMDMFTSFASIEFMAF
jgi:hypothetical protein